MFLDIPLAFGLNFDLIWLRIASYLVPKFNKIYWVEVTQAAQYLKFRFLDKRSLA